jgi:hypothetical protein
LQQQHDQQTWGQIQVMSLRLQQLLCHIKIGDDFDLRSKSFHIRVILKHTKIDILINDGSQSNLILEEVVKKLGLNTKMHHKPYSLNWISK